MNYTHILELNRTELADLLLGHRQDVPSCQPLPVSPWIAMSLMQKAIRRGHIDWALKGASTLLHVSPERLWRRLGITAVEDIGVGDFDTVSLVMAGMTGKVWRKGVGGEWVVASYLIQRMCQTVKCRATDDLVMICTGYPGLSDLRDELPEYDNRDLMGLITADRDMHERALALWFAIGTDRIRDDSLRIRKGEPHAVFDTLCELGYPDTVVEVCREALKKTGEILPALLPLLWRELGNTESQVVPDDMPDEEIIGGIPCWVFDMHTRDGKQAMSRFLKSDCKTSRWMAESTPTKNRAHILGEMLFRIESGCVDKRLHWGTGDRIRRMADLESYGLDEATARTGLTLLRSDLPALNEARRHVTASNFR